MSSATQQLIDQTKTRQPELVTRFQKLIERKELAHAYIVVGNQRQARLEFVLTIMSSLLTNSELENALVENTANWVVINRDANEAIKVDQARQIQAELNAVIPDDQVHILVVQDAQSLTTSGANALLKAIEEPNNNQYIFLLTNQLNAILPTLQSRSQVVTLAEPDPQTLLNELLAAGYDPADAHALSGLVTTVEEADQYMNEGWLPKARQAVMVWFNALAQAETNAFSVIQSQLMSLADENWQQEALYELLILAWRDALVVPYLDLQQAYLGTQSTFSTAQISQIIDQLNQIKNLDQIHMAFQTRVELATLKIEGII